MIRRLRKDIDQTILQDVFVFSYECLKKYKGKWHLERLPLFPGYVFLESNIPKKLISCIENHPYICAGLDIEAELMVLKQEEEELLKKLCGSEHHLAMSRGFIRDGITYVTEGPLMGRENMIRKIDRHKRIARLGAGASKHEKEIKAGLEIILKN